MLTTDKGLVMLSSVLCPNIDRQFLSVVLSLASSDRFPCQLIVFVYLCNPRDHRRRHMTWFPRSAVIFAAAKFNRSEGQ